MTMPSMAIEIRGLTKLYPNGRGIRSVDLAVKPGEIFGFLGPNGAGKSTTIRTLMGFLYPDTGSASVLGNNVVTSGLAVREQVGYLPSEMTLYEDLTGAKNIEFSLKVRGKMAMMERVTKLAQRLEVDLSRRVKTLSRGQKQKVAIINAVAHDPRLLIFDEPTTGLDPFAQEIFHALMREEIGRGKTLFMSSHVLSEVEEMCDRVAIIRDGKIVTTDTVAGLKKQRVKRVHVEFKNEVPNLAQVAGVSDLILDGQRIRFTLVGNLDPLIARLSTHSLVDLTVQDPTLEEVFKNFYSGGGVNVS